MMMHPFLKKTFLFIFAAIVIFPERSPASELWAAAIEPQWRAVRGWPLNDYMTLFTPGAAWPVAQTHLSTFGVSKRFVLEASDQDLGALVDWLKRQHVSLAVQAEPLIASKECGLGVESYGPLDDMTSVAKRLKTFDAPLTYVLLDEPLYFGSRFKGSPGITPCRSEIDYLALQAATKLRNFFQLYPAIKVVDIEPFVGDPGEEWAQSILAWHSSFQKVTGRSIDILQADIVDHFPDAIPEFYKGVDILRRSGIGLGIIYNGLRNAASDAEWVEQASAKFKVIEQILGITPDYAIIQSWTDRPRDILPETTPTTFTGLLARYIEWRRQRADPIARTIQ